MTTPVFDNSLRDLPPDKKIWVARTQADWYLDDTGWYAPDGTHESEWDGVFPEEHLF
jgi:hypothetical protein